MNQYPFNTTDFTMLEGADVLLVTCDHCDYVARFTPAAQPGPMGTELLLHRLKCDAGAIEGGLLFAVDTWEPKKEGWMYYELRIRMAFAEAMELKRADARRVNNLSLAVL